jgi:HEPN domain-containing protein
MRLYEEMVSRAKHFFKVSDYDVSLGRYDIALFHLEQAVQLSLKAYLLKVFGDFPRTHSIKDLIDLSENECFKRLADELWFVVDVLEDAYIGARYLIRRYGEREYREALKFVEGIFKCIDI